MLLLLSFSSDIAAPDEIAHWPRLDWEQGPEVRLLVDPADEDISTALRMLSRGEVLSGALLEALPGREGRWIVYEFWHKLVTEPGVETDWLEALGWRPDRRDSYTVWDPPSSAYAGRPQFAAGIWDPTPLTIEVRVDEDLDDPDLFGPLAASQQGGSSALMALSGAHPGRETIVLRNPAALDLDLITNGESLSNLASGGVVSVRVVGAGPQTSIDSLDVDGFAEPDAVRREWASTDHSAGFWLVIQLTAFVDPTVGIPPGHIFEQLTVNGIQTLAVAASRQVTVQPGSSVTLVVPAWCLNSDLRGPNGEQVRPTPLRARYAMNTSQEEVWNDRRRILSG